MDTRSHKVTTTWDPPACTDVDKAEPLGEVLLDPTAITALRLFFEQLDQWDREEIADGDEHNG